MCIINEILTLKVLITNASDDILIFFLYCSEKIRLEVACELNAKQTIHMKCQVLFSLINN